MVYDIRTGSLGFTGTGTGTGAEMTGAVSAFVTGEDVAVAEIVDGEGAGGGVRDAEGD
jgi:hypothetical protein